MKRDWLSEELHEHFSLSDAERQWLNKRGEAHNLLGLAVELKCFHYLGYFIEDPREIPDLIVDEIARQLGLSADLWQAYDWEGRTARRHRAMIREKLGYRPSTLKDAEALVSWLERSIEANPAAEMQDLQTEAYRWLRQQKLEPPTSLRLDRLIRQAQAAFDNAFAQRIVALLSPLSRQELDKLLLSSGETEESFQKSRFAKLKQNPNTPP